MDNLMTVSTYTEFKRAFDGEIRRQSEGFVRMGYLLRHAEDTNILSESEYKTIAEFAKAEYNLPEDTVSRLIAINKRYSEGGYSDRLQEKYQGYGYTLLAEMLTISDVVIDALPPGVTREDLREVKKEIREENKTTDLEVLMEGQDNRQQAIESNLAKVLYQYYHENIREYPELYKGIKSDEPMEDTALRLLAPSGIGTKMVRIQGIGKFMLSIKGQDQNLELVNLRSNEKESYTWPECAGILQSMCAGKNYKAAFEELYGEPYPEPEKKEIAPAQPKPQSKPSPIIAPEPEPEEQLSLQEPAPNPGTLINTDAEEESKNEDSGDDPDATDDTGSEVPDIDAREESETAASDENDDYQSETQTPELAPAQPESGDITETSQPVEVIESPYRQHLDEVTVYIEQIKELLNDGDYESAYAAGKNLVTELSEMRDIQKSQNEQLAGQMDIADYVE